MFSVEDSPAGDGNSTISYDCTQCSYFTNFPVTVKREKDTDATLTFLIYSQEVAPYLGSIPEVCQHHNHNWFLFWREVRQESTAAPTPPNKIVPLGKSLFMCRRIVSRVCPSASSLLAQTPPGSKRSPKSLTSPRVEFIIFWLLVVITPQRIPCSSKEPVNGRILMATCLATCTWNFLWGSALFDTDLVIQMSGAFALIYLALLIVYLVLCIKYRSILLKLQVHPFFGLRLNFKYAILFSIFLCVLEASAWYFYRLTNNTVGRYSTTSLFVVVFIATTRKSFLHLLVLLVSMGIGMFPNLLIQPSFF